MSYPLIVDSSEEVGSEYYHLYRHQPEGQELTEKDTGQGEYLRIRGKGPSGHPAPPSLSPLFWQREEVETRRALRKGTMGRGNLTLFYVSFI